MGRDTSCANSNEQAIASTAKHARDYLDFPSKRIGLSERLGLINLSDDARIVNLRQGVETRESRQHPGNPDPALRRPIRLNTAALPVRPGRERLTSRRISVELETVQ